MIRKLGLFLCGFIYSCLAEASPFGINISTLLISKDPPDFHSYRTALLYQPDCLNRGNFQLYFDASYGYWWVDKNKPHPNISIYSVAPYLRYYFIKHPCFSPFIEASVGLSYLSQTRIEKRKLGIHFAFQDQLTLGVAFGTKQQFYTSFSALHYSNASFSEHNSGITVPLMLNMGYRF